MRVKEGEGCLNNIGRGGTKYKGETTVVRDGFITRSRTRPMNNLDTTVFHDLCSHMEC